MTQRCRSNAGRKAGNCRRRDKSFTALSSYSHPETLWKSGAHSRCLKRSSTGSSCLRLDIPIREGMEILMRFRDKDPLRNWRSSRLVIQAQKAVTSVTVSDASARYIIDIIEATRHDEKITLGVSPRGSIALMKAAQVKAVLEGRDFITPDDVKKMAVPVLAHRIMIKGHAISSGTENAENTSVTFYKVPVRREI